MQYPFEELSSREGFDLAPGLSVIIPAYNEEVTIASSVKSSLHLEYPEYEVIVCVDGSTDQTLEVLIDRFSLITSSIDIALPEGNKVVEKYKSEDYPNLTVLNLINGSKSSALNHGILFSKFDYVCCLDADSILEPKALVNITLPIIESDNVVAVGGTIRVINSSKVVDGRVAQWNFPRSFLAAVQVPEFIRSFVCNRVAWSWMNSSLIISGAFGVFKKDILQKIGGYSTHSVTEDMDLILKVHKYALESKLNYKVSFVPDPVCWTEVPTKFKHLISQRRRWFTGMLQVFWDFRSMFFSPKYRKVGLLGIPLFFIMEVVAPVLEVITYVLFIIGLNRGIVSSDFLIIFFVISVLIHMINSIFAIIIEESFYRRSGNISDLVKITFFSLIENLGYRQFLNILKVFSLFTFPFRKQAWGYKVREGL